MVAESHNRNYKNDIHVHRGVWTVCGQAVDKLKETRSPNLHGHFFLPTWSGEDDLVITGCVGKGFDNKRTA
jgi:hypothetical protein